MFHILDFFFWFLLKCEYEMTYVVVGDIGGDKMNYWFLCLILKTRINWLIFYKIFFSTLLCLNSNYHHQISFINVCM